MSNIIQLQTVRHIRTTHQLFDAVIRHVELCKEMLPCEDIDEPGTLTQAQMDALGVYAHFFFSAAEGATPKDFAEYMHDVAFLIGEGIMEDCGAAGPKA